MARRYVGLDMIYHGGLELIERLPANRKFVQFNLLNLATSDIDLCMHYSI